MKIYKSVTYAFPRSKNAATLGFAKEGCWHISLRYDTSSSNEFNGGSFMAHNAEGFIDPCDPDLISLFHETAGEIDPSFLEYGEPEILKEIKQK